MTARAVRTIAYLAAIVAANWAIATWPPLHLGPLAAPSGVLFAGAVLSLRDALHAVAGRAWLVGAIIVGSALSAAGAPSWRIAAASGLAFLLSELADSTVYARLHDAGHPRSALVASNLIGALIDSAVFLPLAFGSLAYLPGQWLVKSLTIIPALAARRLYLAVTR